MTEFWPETTRERWVRRNFWFSVAALVLLEILLLGLVNAYPDMFPQRWHLRPLAVEGATHRYMAVQAAVLVPMELALAWFFYQGRGSAARWAAAGFGAWLLLNAVIVELLLASVRVPITTWHVLFLLYVALSHIGYAIFGSSERRPRGAAFFWSSITALPPSPPGAGAPPSAPAVAPPLATNVLARRAEALRMLGAARTGRSTPARRDQDRRRRVLNRLTIIGAVVGCLTGILRAGDPSGGVADIPIGFVVGAAVGRLAGVVVFALLDRIASG